MLHSVPRPLLQAYLPLYSEGLLFFFFFFVYLPAFLLLADTGIHSDDTSCLLIWLQDKMKQAVSAPLQCHLPLLSLCVCFFVFFHSVENQELPQDVLSKKPGSSCSALITPEPCRDFDCAAVCIQLLHEGSRGWKGLIIHT